MHRVKAVSCGGYHTAALTGERRGLELLAEKSQATHTALFASSAGPAPLVMLRAWKTGFPHSNPLSC